MAAVTRFTGATSASSLGFWPSLDSRRSISWMARSLRQRKFPGDSRGSSNVIRWPLMTEDGLQHSL